MVALQQLVVTEKPRLRQEVQQEAVRPETMQKGVAPRLSIRLNPRALLRWAVYATGFMVSLDTANGAAKIWAYGKLDLPRPPAFELSPGTEATTLQMIDEIRELVSKRYGIAMDRLKITHGQGFLSVTMSSAAPEPRWRRPFRREPEPLFATDVEVLTLHTREAGGKFSYFATFYSINLEKLLKRESVVWRLRSREWYKSVANHTLARIKGLMDNSGASSNTIKNYDIDKEKVDGVALKPV